MNLFQNEDGANYQAKAVLAYLRNYDGIECSWDKENKDYAARPEVNRWHNCREQGYIVSLRSRNYKNQINIAFFEHRNSDNICAIKFELNTTNPPTINDIPENHPFNNNKYAVDYEVERGEVVDISEWIYNELEEFWKSHQS